jgi:hypothetical protein
MPQVSPGGLPLVIDSPAFIPVSTVLQRLHDEAPADHFTLDCVMEHLQKRSFGIIIFLLGLVAMVPGASLLAGLVLMVPAFQMILGHSAPAFPRRIATHLFPTRDLAALMQRSVPVLRRLEKIIHPRWHVAHGATGRLVGVVVMLLSALLIFIPIPLSNVVPALMIAFIALAWIEEDGLYLAVSLLAAVLVIAAVVAMICAAVLGAAWIVRLW